MRGKNLTKKVLGNAHNNLSKMSINNILPTVSSQTALLVLGLLVSRPRMVFSAR